MEKKTWDFVYEEQFPDFAYCGIGIISDGVGYLFFRVFANKEGECEKCSVYNSMAMDEYSLLCQYDWTDDNDELLLNTLNNGDVTDISKLSFRKVGK